MEHPVTTSSSVVAPGSARATATATLFARIGLWLIPIYGALLALSTLTHHPDYDTDFQSYADYITTDRFLVSHLGASIAGAAVGLLGVVAALALLVRGPAVTAAILGAAFMIVGNLLFTALFGVAAFARQIACRASSTPPQCAARRGAHATVFPAELPPDGPSYLIGVAACTMRAPTRLHSVLVKRLTRARAGAARSA